MKSKKSPCSSFPKKNLIIFGIFFFSSTCVFCQDSPERFLQWMKDDPVSIVKSIGTKQLLTAAAFGGALSVVSLSDKSTSQNFQLHYQNSNFLDFTNKLGDWRIMTPVSAGIFGASLLTNDTKFQDAAFTSLQSVIFTNIVTKSGKFVFGRERPGQDDGPHDFDFVQPGGTSFPSGHTATAFAFFTPWVVYYPGPVTYSLMAIPVGTAIARVAKGKHWVTDVAAGAGIGFSMAYYLSKKHLSFHSDRIQIIPSAGQDNFSLTVNFAF